MARASNRHAGAGGRTFGYARVSGREQASEGTSLESQSARFDRYAERERVEVDARVEVGSASAALPERRVELKRLMAEAKPGDTIIVCKVDRWSRNTPFGVQSVRDLVARGVRWLSLDEGIDASTPQGDSTLGIMAWAADQEHKRIRERTVGRRHELLEEGYWCNGAHPPFGLCRGTGPSKMDHLILQPVPEDVPILIEMYRRCVAGNSVADLSDWLPDVRPDRGWSPALVKSMLRSRVYIGEVRAPSGWVRGKHAAIVPRDLWERAQVAKLSRDKGGRSPGATSRTSTWLCRPALARCGHCGGGMRSAFGRRVEYAYLACRDHCGASMLRIVDVDGPLDGLVRARLIELRHLLAQPATAIAETPRARDFAGERSRLDAALERVQRGYVDGVLDARAVARERERVQAALGKLEREESEAGRTAAATSPAARAEALASITVLARAWGKAPVAKRREILEDLAAHVALRHGEPPEPTWRTEAELAVEL